MQSERKSLISNEKFDSALAVFLNILGYVTIKNIMHSSLSIYLPGSTGTGN